jgi:hypothetical protein
MNHTDLAVMFEDYVKGYTVGTDDVVTKFVGEHTENSGGIEAELDIQYIMGVSPGIQTEFWEFPGQDFGGDLNMWTSNLTSNADIPLVHSVSYGWQGDLSQIGVKQADVDVVDGNFAKLAAKGISIMISSGDSGSGYAPVSACETQPAKGVGIAGTVKSFQIVKDGGSNQCCQIASNSNAAGWTYSEEAKLAAASGITFKDSPYHVVQVEDPKTGLKQRDVFLLTGKITDSTGVVMAKKTKTNGESGAAVPLTFTPSYKKSGEPVLFYNVSATFGGVDMTGKAEAFGPTGQPEMMFNIIFDCGKMENCVFFERGQNPPPPPPPPPPGYCTVYSAVTSHTATNATTFSGFAKKQSIVLWASWPASSPWVTAVGATRFVGQTVGNAEMATDQFGSGGGFSSMFDQSNAGYQVDAVAKYLSTVSAETLPPASSFNPKGRATPDVSALGEGYQVIVAGHPTSVGGTSASSPAFAGLMSLVNEARLAAGKPAMGFLNPFLYKNADAFTDVTLGSNKIGRGGQPLQYGWNCSTGTLLALPERRSHSAGLCHASIRYRTDGTALPMQCFVLYHDCFGARGYHRIPRLPEIVKTSVRCDPAACLSGGLWGGPPSQPFASVVLLYTSLKVGTQQLALAPHCSTNL